jgi:HEPN domain-containing protein
MSQPPQPSADVQSGVLLARRLFNRVKETQSALDDVTVRVAIILVDQAIEHVLWLVLRSLGGTPKKGASLENVIECIETIQKTNGKAPFGLGALLPIRHQRNCVQHDGTRPDTATVRAMTLQGEAACTKVIQEVFGLRFQTASSADFVKDSQVKEALEAAYRDIEGGNYDDALGKAKFVENRVYLRWGNSFRMAMTMAGMAESMVLAQRPMATLIIGMPLDQSVIFGTVTRHIEVKVGLGIHDPVPYTIGNRITRAPSLDAQRVQAFFAVDYAATMWMQAEEQIERFSSIPNAP